MMLETYRNLSERERRLLMVLGAVVGLLVLVYGLIFPTLNFAQSSARDYARAERLAALTENLEAPGTGPEDDRGLRSVVTQRADSRKIIYTRINQSPDGAIEMDLQDVSHAAFFAWLEQLEREDGIVVASALVNPGEETGTIEARVTLTREGS